MDIKSFLSPDDVLIDVRAPDKKRLLEDLSNRAAAALGIDAGVVSAAILKREELGSTGTGEGVALPHSRIQEVERPFGVLARLRKPIDFSAIDGAPVDLVFLLVLPGAPDGEQLKALASVARKLRSTGITADLRHAGDEREMYRIIAAER